MNNSTGQLKLCLVRDRNVRQEKFKSPSRDPYLVMQDIGAPILRLRLPQDRLDIVWEKIITLPQVSQSIYKLQVGEIWETHRAAPGRTVYGKERIPLDMMVEYATDDATVTEFSKCKYGNSLQWVLYAQISQEHGTHTFSTATRVRYIDETNNKKKEEFMIEKYCLLRVVMVTMALRDFTVA